MNQPSLLYSLAAILLLVSGHKVGGSSSQRIASETILRHVGDEEPTELNVDARDTYDNQYADLMHSPCRPERDGFFGSTSGEPVTIQYGFMMEALPLAPINNLKAVIEEAILDEVLSTAFPEICGFRRRNLQAANGFWFGPIEASNEETCMAGSSDVKNFCGVFEGAIKVYGRDMTENKALTSLSLVDEVLSRSADSLHQDIVRLAPVNELFKVLEVQPSGEPEPKIVNFETVGIVAGSVMILSTLIWFFCIHRRRNVSYEKGDGNLSSPRCNDENLHEIDGVIRPKKKVRQRAAKDHDMPASSRDAFERRHTDIDHEEFYDITSSDGDYTESSEMPEIENEFFLQKKSDGII